MLTSRVCCISQIISNNKAKILTDRVTCTCICPQRYTVKIFIWLHEFQCNINNILLRYITCIVIHIQIFVENRGYLWIIYVLFILVNININQDILRKKYPYNCFMMTLYQSLLMALVSLPFCVLKIWGLKKYMYMYMCKCNCSLSAQKLSYWSALSRF